MTLLNDIIAACTSSDEKLSSVLRKCLVLSYELNNDRLKIWSEKELNGYEHADMIPEYRTIHVGAKGFFIGFGQMLHDQPIPSIMLKEEHRHFAEEVKLLQPVAAYEDDLKEHTAIIEWPANLVLLYQSKFFEGRMALNRAWQEVPSSAMKSLVDTLRTRILTFALELRKEASENTDSKGDLADIPRKDVDRIVNYYIYGGTNIIAESASDIQVDARQQVVVGDIASLRSAAKQIGVKEEDLSSLEAAIKEDQMIVLQGEETAIGPKTKGWLATAAGKLGASGLKVGEAVTSKVLEGLVKAYLGIS